MATHCISHIKDVDGLSSAALVLAAKGGTYALTDYDELFAELENIPGGTDNLFLCDLGTDASKFQLFSERMKSLSNKMKVTYIDHHYLSPELKQKLETLPIRLVHDPLECSSVLTYLTLKNELPQDAKYLALFGAVTDYMDSSPFAGKAIERFDRQFVLLESTILSYALAKNAGAPDFLDSAVRGLASMKKPHEIEGAAALAIKQLQTVAELAREVGTKGVMMTKLAYMQTEESSTGNVAKLLLGAFDAVVGVSYKTKTGGKVEMSLRGTSESKVHLGQAISEIAGRHGGNGGGHQKAAGCSIPASEVTAVLSELDRIL